MKFPKPHNKILRASGLLATCGLALAACGPKAADFSILAAGTSAFQGSVANNKVDILWVIDNSGSMLTKQQKLAASFSSFASVFVNKGFDFHMAIVTSDVRAPALGQGAQFQGNPTVITNNTANFQTVFENNVVVGDTGDSQAKELEAIQLALSNPNLSGANAGFLRSDAHLAVIEVSDADDDDSGTDGYTTTNTLSFLQNLKPDIYDVINRTYKHNFTVSTVGVQSLTDPDCAALLPLIEVATKFISLSNSTNGSFASICKADFSSGLSTISQTIAQAITMIPLSRVPDVSTLTVAFNGVNVPMDNTNGFSYNSTKNAVVFNGSYIPMANTAISINYIPNDIIR